MTDVEMLEMAIERSGMNATEFAKEKLVRLPKTIHRWLRREHPIPEEVRNWLRKQVMPTGRVTRARIRRRVARARPKSSGPRRT